MPPMGPEARKQLQTAMRLGAAGLELGGSIFVGVLVGSWLDKRYGTAPWLALTGLLLGSALGFGALFWIIRIKSDAAKPNASHDHRTDPGDRPPPSTHD